jgi:hypothetical protein
MAETQPTNVHDRTQKVRYVHPPRIDGDGKITPAVVMTEANPAPHYMDVDGAESDITEMYPDVEINVTSAEENIDAILEKLKLNNTSDVPIPVFLLLKDLVFSILTEPFASQAYEVKILHILELLQVRANKTVLSEESSSGTVEYPIADIVQSIKAFQALGREFLFLKLLLTRR